MPSGCLGAGRGIRVSRVCRWLGGLQISFRADAVGMRSGKDFRGALSLPRECHQQVVDSIPTAVPLLVIPRAAHVKELDEPQLVVAAVAKFLHTCEQTREMPPF